MISAHAFQSQPLRNTDGTFGQLHGMTIGYGPSDGVQLPPAIANLLSIDGSTVYAISSAEVSSVYNSLLPHFRRTYHAPRTRPTLADTAAFMTDVGITSGPLMSSPMQSTILMNGIAWQGEQNRKR